MSDGKAVMGYEAVADVFSEFADPSTGDCEVWKLKEILPKLNFAVTDVELETMIKKVDRDGDGVMSCDELVLLLEEHSLYGSFGTQNPESESEQEIFVSWRCMGGTANRSGTVLVGEVLKMLDFFELTCDVPESASDHLDYEEFRAFMLRINPHLNRTYIRGVPGSQ
ncbi:hypothetical protein KIPB_008954 [Kipferlia bialata]|uniref:EF-hand domain-containing protein n=1 Tax=Kipferlia bialata TaxID=797122 RepID=A0A9K3D1F7_9EUKA|nr:hypothetical protein KIPB_008954 [Kipferlia bialata]|eukprot:g8954.t1